MNAECGTGSAEWGPKQFTSTSVFSRDAALPKIRLTNGSLKHIVREGSREHVLWYDSRGQHCTEPDCEINRIR